MATVPDDLAIWVVTPNGMELAGALAEQWTGAKIHCSWRLRGQGEQPFIQTFDRLAPAVAAAFNCFKGHIFIMATGIVVRTIAPLLQSKTRDPAVVVVDDRGSFAISLISGHIGGANRLAGQVADVLGARPVITTATDVNQRPAIDTLAVSLGLKIENPAAIKNVNMALLTDEMISVHDPCGFLKDALGERCCPDSVSPDLYVDDTVVALPGDPLKLRPASLVAGIGCNRGTPEEEIRTLLQSVLADQGLSPLSLRCMASIDLKKDEQGLLEAARALQVPIRFFSQDELNQIRHVPNPSPMVAKHVGVQSVCEAAAILAAHQGELIVPKQKTANVTVAIARHSSLSSASAREA